VRILLSVVLLALPAVALASGDAGHGAEAVEGEQPIILLLTLLGLVGGAYLMTHFVVDRLQKQLLFLSGAEYILLGLLLGPQTGVLADLGSLSPVIAFAAGWIGILYGMEMNVRRLLSEADRSTRIAVIDALVTGGGVSAAAYFGFTAGLGIGAEEAALSAGVLGCAAAAGSSSAVDLLISRYNSAGDGLLGLLRRASRLSDVIAILAFGVLFCVFHQGETLTETPPDTSDWLLFTVALGGLLGWLFAAFLGDDSSENNRFLALVGIIAFASGAAFFLNLSVLAVNLILGAVLVNTRPGPEIYQTLSRTGKPVALLLLIFAGVRFEVVPIAEGFAVAGGYIVLRWLCKAAGGWLATSGTELRRDIFRGMLAQDNVAIAIALSFRLIYSGDSVDLAYCAILASVMLNELIAARALRGLLVDAGDVRQDVVIAGGRA